MQDQSEAPLIPVYPLVPVMTRQRFCELSGVSEEVARGWMQKGSVPTVKVGKRRLVNVAALTRVCLEEEEL